MLKNNKEFFLKDDSILSWERPIEDGYRRLSFWYNGSTKIIEQIGFDTIDEVVGSFKIIGSTVKYLVDIIYLDDGWFKLPDEFVSGEKKREILFSGGLTIYKKGQIPGTEIQGDNLERQGNIWVARSPEPQFYNSNGLKNLIFGNPPDFIGRVESILLGYQTQEDKQENVKRKRLQEDLRKRYLR